MKLRKLEMSLQQVLGFSAPNAALEQYLTPPSLAARFLHDAYMHGDIEGMRVLDLGCGTGMLSVGAALLGAEVFGVDCDASALLVAEQNAARLGLDISFTRCVIPSSFDGFDTVVMNPPFGAQSEHADRPFIETAVFAAPIVWGIFNKGTIPFLKAYSEDTSMITDMVSAKLTIPKQFWFHTQDSLEIPVEIVRMIRK